MAANSPSSCADTGGNFCPEGQEPINGECAVTVPGCTDQNAYNFDAAANRDDGSCGVDKVTWSPTTWHTTDGNCGSVRRPTLAECRDADVYEPSNSNRLMTSFSEVDAPHLPSGCIAYDDVWFYNTRSTSHGCTTGQTRGCLCINVAPVCADTSGAEVVAGVADGSGGTSTQCACGGDSDTMCGNGQYCKVENGAAECSDTPLACPSGWHFQGDVCVDECDAYFAPDADNVCVRGSCPAGQQLQLDLTCEDSVDCVWSAPGPADCDARCGTVSAVKTVEEAFGGACAQQPTYVCAHGDGGCSDGQTDAWEECARLKGAYDEEQWVVANGDAHRAEDGEQGAACCLDNPADECLEWSQEYQRLECCGDRVCNKVSCEPGYAVAGDECDQRCELIECERHDSDGIYEYCLDDSWTDGDSVDDCEKKRVVSWKKDDIDWVEMEKKGAIRAACVLEDMGGCQTWFDGCNECTVSSDGGLPSCTKKYCSEYAEPKCNDVVGCTDPAFTEFDPDADVDDGSCATAAVWGCTDPAFGEFDPLANTDDGSCENPKYKHINSGTCDSLAAYRRISDISECEAAAGALSIGYGGGSGSTFYRPGCVVVAGNQAKFNKNSQTSPSCSDWSFDGCLCVYN